MNKNQIWIVYTHFCDDPSSIYGIFDNEHLALEAIKSIEDDFKGIRVIELNTLYKKNRIELN